MRYLIHGEGGSVTVVKIEPHARIPTVDKGPLRLGGIRCDDIAYWDSLLPSTDITAFPEQEIVIRKDDQTISIYVRDRDNDG